MSHNALAKSLAANPLAWIPFSLIVLTLAACGGGAGSSGETINGIAVPPVPDMTANQATVSGVDSNGNGIRDDVERMLASEFGNDGSMYREAVDYARTQQAALTAPTQATVEAHISMLRCVRDSQKLAQLKKVTVATLDAPIRKGAYARAFAGTVLSTSGCP